MLRLERILSNRGYCTRGETDRFLDDHVVTHAGVRLRRSGVQVDAEKLLIDDQPLDAEKLYVLYHKPAGCICAHGDAGPEGGTLVYDLLPARWVARNPVVTTVGRLDKETTGLLLLSDDGQFVHKLTSPKHHVPRVYQAELQHDLRGNEKAIFASGKLMLANDDRALLPAELRVTGKRTCEITVHEGRYHQVRRMFAAVGNHVVKLHRSGFGQMELGDLPEGQWRMIDAAAVTKLEK